MAGSGEIIRGVLAEYGGLSLAAVELRDDDDLYQVGLSSHASVNVMLALEDAFGVEFPDALLRKSTFASVDAIQDALTSLGVAADVDPAAT